MSVFANFCEPSVTFDERVVFTFEASLSSSEKRQWMVEHRHEVFYYVGLYLLFVFSCQKYMRNRPRMELRGIIATWNIILSVFSIVALCRMLPESMSMVRNSGFTYTVCNLDEGKISGFWGWMFVLSRVVELGDTIFIVLRKQQLTFLHWYHHVTVLIYSWYSYSEYTAPARWFAVMNYFAHSLMYPYFALRAMRVEVPNILPMSITTIQVLQMIFGCYVCYVAYAVRSEGQYCQCKEHIAIYGALMYLSYFALFVKFFIHKYITLKRKEEKAE